MIVQDKQHRVMEMLFQGAREVEIEQKCGVSRETILHWKHNAAFQDQLGDKRAEHLHESKAFLNYLAGEALHELQKMMCSPTEQIRLSACQIILENAALNRNHS